MSRFRPKLPARLRGRKFDATGDEVGVDNTGRGQFTGDGIDLLVSPQMQVGDEISRMAAIAAVLSMLQSGGADPSQAGRQAGPAWSLDHRSIASGRKSVMAVRQGRSAWR
jgi:hypothetical protein